MVKKKSIKQILREAYNKKVTVKIRYYSPMNNEITYREIAIYDLQKDFLTAFCYKRQAERTFVKERIGFAKIIGEKYALPEDWTPQSKVWST